MDPSSFVVSKPLRRAVFAAEKMGKASLFAGSQMMVGLNAFEPGQEHAAHRHAGMDKLYQVLAGSGEILLGDEVHLVKAGALVFAPADLTHGVRNTGGGQLVLLVVMAPPPPAK